MTPIRVPAMVWKVGNRRFFSKKAAIHRAAHIEVRTEMGCPNGRDRYDCDCAFHVLGDDEQAALVRQREIDIWQAMMRRDA